MVLWVAKVWIEVRRAKKTFILMQCLKLTWSFNFRTLWATQVMISRTWTVSSGPTDTSTSPTASRTSSRGSGKEPRPSSTRSRRWRRITTSSWSGSTLLGRRQCSIGKRYYSFSTGDDFLGTLHRKSRCLAVVINFLVSAMLDLVRLEPNQLSYFSTTTAV